MSGADGVGKAFEGGYFGANLSDFGLASAAFGCLYVGDDWGKGSSIGSLSLGEVVDELVAVLGTIERLAAGLGGDVGLGGYRKLRYHNTMV